MITVTATKHIQINDDEIAYFLTEKGVVEIGLHTGEIRTLRTSIRELAKKYPHFIQTGNKCLVDPNAIRSISYPKQIIRTQHKELPISRDWKRRVKEQLNEINMEIPSRPD